MVKAYLLFNFFSHPNPCFFPPQGRGEIQNLGVMFEDLFVSQLPFLELLYDGPLAKQDMNYSSPWVICVQGILCYFLSRFL